MVGRGSAESVVTMVGEAAPWESSAVVLVSVESRVSDSVSLSVEDTRVDEVMLSLQS